MSFNPLSIEFDISRIKKYTIRFVNAILAAMIYGAIYLVVLYGIKTANLGIGFILEIIFGFVLSFGFYMIVSSIILLLSLIIVMDNMDLIKFKDDEK